MITRVSASMHKTCSRVTGARRREACECACRVTGVTHLCDHPKEASSRHKVVRCTVDCTAPGAADALARDCGSGVSVDAELLAREGPGLVLAQDVSHACSADAQAVAEVGPLRSCCWCSACAVCSGGC
jgi:hypothetical protein